MEMQRERQKLLPPRMQMRKQQKRLQASSMTVVEDEYPAEPQMPGSLHPMSHARLPLQA